MTGSKRTAWRRMGAMVRSGLRRYPRVVAGSIRGTAGAGEGVPTPEALARIGEHPLAASWLGHATTLLRLGDATILVDPVFSERIGPRIATRVVGLPRLAPLAIDPARLPAIDLVLITHAHFDHLDRPTLRALASPRTTVVTASRTRRLVPRGFAQIVELTWGEAVRVGEVRVCAIRPVHWGARTALDRRRGFNSYLLESGAGRVLVAGDTAHTRAFDDVPGTDLAVFGVGAYEPWDHRHATPEQVWSMFVAHGASRLLPVHHSTFELSDEHPSEPMRRLLRAAGEESSRIIELEPGGVWVPEGA